MCQSMRSSEGKLSKDTMIIQQQDILESFKHLMQSKNTIGGQDFESLSRTVQGCGTCQQFKIDRNPSKPAFVPIKGAKLTRLFSSCSMDLITDLPPVDNCDSILVVVDRGNTKGAILIPMAKTLTQEGAGQLLLDNLYKQFGLPDKMLSDRGPQFAAKAFHELLKLLGIKSNLTMAYHPQTDGVTERVKQEIEAYLLIYCSVHPTE
jgi:hypothetical protein